MTGLPCTLPSAATYGESIVRLWATRELGAASARRRRDFFMGTRRGVAEIWSG
jgi:hypothetical protein